MDEELKKRYTDCVYFLASPLTCKKGIECEYRHSESARLNPRDCWYWLAGSCLNLTCAFRHPPLEVHTEVLSESAPPPYQCSAPVNKVNVPCYFYFNGFCNKGDGCSFLHGSHEDGITAWKSSKTASVVAGAPPLENKTSTGSDAGSRPTEADRIPFGSDHKGASEIKIKVNEDVHPSAHNNVNVKEDVHLSAHNSVNDRSSSPQISGSGCEEAAVVNLDTLLPGKGLIQSRSYEQSSEEQVNGHTDREDWLESSPGFDVLVDDTSENLGFEDDPEYLLAVDRDGREFDGQFLEYDCQDPTEYDPMYPDAGTLYKQDRDDSYDHFDGEQRFDDLRNDHGCSRERMLHHVLPWKRKISRVDMVTNVRAAMDLRDHLKKRRVIDGCRPVSRWNLSSLLVDRSRERSRQHGARWHHRRLMTEVDNNRDWPFRESGTLLNGTSLRDWGRHSRSSRPSQRHKERRHSKHQFLSSEVSGKPILRKKRHTEKSSTFTGPKSLAEIKEEKRKTSENGNFSGRFGHSSRATEEFQGPKPLSEILKDKKKPEVNYLKAFETLAESR